MHDKLLRFAKTEFNENGQELDDFLKNFKRDNVDFKHLLEERRTQPRKDFFSKRKVENIQDKDEEKDKVFMTAIQKSKTSFS